MTGAGAAGDERSVDQIRDDIGTTRAVIAALAQNLDRRIHETLDWRTHVARHPLAATLIAAGAGTAAVLMVRRARRDPWRRVGDSVADTVRDLRWQLADTLEAIADGARGGSGRSHDDGSALRGALAAAIAKAGLDFVRQKMQPPSPTTPAGSASDET